MAETRSGDKVFFACASGREWPIPSPIKTFELYVLLLKNTRHDFATKLALFGRKKKTFSM